MNFKTKIAVLIAIVYSAATVAQNEVFAVGGGGDGAGGSGTLTNPLKSTSIQEFLLKIIDVLLVFALPIIVLYIMYAGFLFVTAQGNEGQLHTAKSALLWSVVGGVIVLGARLIISVIQGTVTAF